MNTHRGREDLFRTISSSAFLRTITVAGNTFDAFSHLDALDFLLRKLGKKGAFKKIATGAILFIVDGIALFKTEGEIFSIGGRRAHPNERGSYPARALMHFACRGVTGDDLYEGLRTLHSGNLWRIDRQKTCGILAPPLIAELWVETIEIPDVIISREKKRTISFHESTSIIRAKAWGDVDTGN